MGASSAPDWIHIFEQKEDVSEVLAEELDGVRLCGAEGGAWRNDDTGGGGEGRGGDQMELGASPSGISARLPMVSGL